VVTIYLRSAKRMRVHNVMVVPAYRNLCSGVERATWISDSRAGQCYLTPFGKARTSRPVFVLKRCAGRKSFCCLGVQASFGVNPGFFVLSGRFYANRYSEVV